MRTLSKEHKSATELSNELNTSSQSVSNYLRKLRNLDIVQKEPKDGRSRPYSLNVSSLFDLFEEYWEEELNTKLRNRLAFHDRYSIEYALDELSLFLEKYSNNYFEDKEDSTPKKFLVEDFRKDINRTIKHSRIRPEDERYLSEEDIPTWFQDIALMLDVNRAEDEFRLNRVSKSLEDYHDSPRKDSYSFESKL